MATLAEPTSLTCDKIVQPINLTEDKSLKPLNLTAAKLAERINLRRNKLQDVKIYIYRFSDGKIYIGFTTTPLEVRHNQHKTRPSISPISKYLNSGERYQGPILETTVKVNLYNGEIYKILRKILDTYTNDTKQILNTNLKLFGY